MTPAHVRLRRAVGMRRAEIAYAATAFLLSASVTGYYLTHWPRRTLDECLQANNDIPLEDIYFHLSTDLNGCLETSVEAANRGNATGAVLASNFYSLKDGSPERVKYFTRLAANLGGTSEKWELIRTVDSSDRKICREILPLLRSFKPFRYNWERIDAITLADVKRDCAKSLSEK